ncbi:phenylacetate--CoA ligase family protein, partial [bacterium]|nr:phenylacetate--CoA ligase family protein [bacterium]
TVRGVNVYPSAIENWVHAVDGVSEFRVTVSRAGELDTLEIEIECADGCDTDAAVRKVSQAISAPLGLNPRVRAVPQKTLPRFELKARRFVVKR